MTNPNNAVGTNGAFGGRTSVNAFNDIMGAFQSRGVLSGWGIVPSSGMTVAVGGSGTTRDVAVAEDASGNKTSVNNISGAPISVTLDSAPASNSRYDAIVAYVDKPPISAATQDNPECCGIIKVTGTAASTPAYPNDSAIRTAITADGASGANAYYVVLGYVLVASGTTTITSGMITAGLTPLTNAMVDAAHIQDGAITTAKLANLSVTEGKLASNSVTTSKIANSSVSVAKLETTVLNSADITFTSPYTAGTGVFARKIGNMVCFYQGVRCPAITSTDNQTVAFTLPSGFRPASSTTNYIVQFGIGRLGRVRIADNGEVKISKYDVDVPNNTYIQMPAITFSVV